MRRRWTVPVVVGVLAVSIIAGYIFRPKDDGLNWLRKYGPLETVSDVTHEKGPWLGVNGKWTRNEFQLKLPIPDDLKPEVKAFCKRIEKSKKVFAYFAPGKIVVDRFEN